MIIPILAAMIFLQPVSQDPVPFPVVTLVPFTTPTPIATSQMLEFEVTVEVPHSDIYNWLATADANIAALPANINAPASGVTPPLETGSTLFRYAKYLLSYQVADEVLGPFAPIVQHGVTIIALVFALGGVYLGIMIVGMIIRGIVWLIKRILSFVPGMG